MTVEDSTCPRTRGNATLPEDRQALLGQIPLEMMDRWIDLRTQRLVGNPEHGGEWQAEVF